MTDDKKPAADPDSLALTNRRLDQIAQGFSLFLSRNTPGVSSQRAAYMFNHCVRPMHEALETGLKPVRTRELAAPIIENEEDRLKALLEVRKESDALWATVVEIPRPRRRLTIDDLPPRLKGKMRGPAGSALDGADNASDNGQIQSLLAPEFLELRDPDAEKGEDADEPGDSGGAD
jgi:hypothetical protein